MDKRFDAVMSMFIVIFGVWLIHEARGIPHGSVYDPIGVAGLIIGIAVLFIIGGTALLVRRAVRWRKDGSGLIPSDGVEDEPGIQASAIRAFAMWGLTAGWVYIMPTIGFLISTPVYLLSGMALVGMRRWIRAVIFTAILTAILYLLFVRALNVRLPSGSIWLRT